MGVRAFFIIIVIAATALAPALATDHTVGDAAGWKLNTSYTEWAQRKDFRVGDTLLFMYKPGVHNVLKVSGPDFQNCVNSNVSQIPLTSGNDVIHLATPGKKWYICDIGDHCSLGMKLVITVSADGPIPAPVPGAPAPSAAAAAEVSPLISFVWMLAAVVAAVMA